MKTTNEKAYLNLNPNQKINKIEEKP